MIDRLPATFADLLRWWTLPSPSGQARGGDRGEGVISAAIAVLIMAGIGALMWVGFKTIWEDTEDNTQDKVSEIGE